MQRQLAPDLYRMQMEVLRDESNKSGVARLYNRTNTYTHATARSGPTKHTQMSIGIDYKHTHHARKQRNRHSNSSTPHHIYTNMHAKSLSGIARQIHIMPENKETYIQTIQAPTIYIYIQKHAHKQFVRRSPTSKHMYNI